MNRRKKPRWMRRVLLYLSILIGFGGIWSGYVVYQIEKTIQEAIPRQADVGIVLGAAVWGDGPSPGLRERLDQALWLYQKKYVPVLLVTGGLGEGKQLTEAAVMKEYLVERGVPAEHILMETQSTSTYENLLFGQQVMAPHPFKNALLISHDYHLFRAVTMAEALGLSVSPVAVHSQYLFKPYHEAREVLAITYWHFSRFWSSALQTLILA
ncbi:YdcF family protein [Brevibacillus choshinensis]|uniref:YdcF family protein n=1 Tax=Brevibacillus choshinensis TaxID=54911 RepID=UPI002E1E6034|nr:YdcF family protein [Brevibacillus choshinensis]MED4753524.1 YdcF family protein [Brevibacillus choshinensis]